MALEKELLEEAMYKSPLALLSISDPQEIARLNEYLPYSIGFEIECTPRKEFTDQHSRLFQEIPYIISSDIRPQAGEIRFRIPYGIKGMLCLYLLCEQLKVFAELNMGSGTHFHVDMTDCFPESDNVKKRLVENNQEWVLAELDTWGYKGSYNKRDFRITKGGWIGLRDGYRTAEIRICEMTFDYTLLLTRFIHGCSIVRRLKEYLVGKDVIDNTISRTSTDLPDKKSIFDYLKNSIGTEKELALIKLQRTRDEMQDRLKELQTPTPLPPQVDVKQVINSRIKKYV